MAKGDEVRRDAAPSVKFTYDDFLLFPDDGKRHEIIDGEHYVTPSPNREHQRVSLRLSVALANFLDAHPLGEVFAAPFDVVFSHFDVVEPDLLYVSNARREVLTEKHVRGTPDLVVEILSPGTRRIDETKKLRLYERWGVQEYWIADPQTDTLRIVRLENGALVRIAELDASQDEVLTTPLLPGFSVALQKIFASPPAPSFAAASASRRASCVSG